MLFPFNRAAQAMNKPTNITGSVTLECKPWRYKEYVEDSDDEPTHKTKVVGG